MKDDHSRSFAQLRSCLVHKTGRTYREFLNALKPDYKKVWVQIALGYWALIGTLALVASAQNEPWLLLAGLFGMISVGYWVAFITLFVHEAGHYNVSGDRALNDRLANFFLCWFTGMDIGAYRQTHLQHHAALGTPEDTENSYFNDLSPLFVLRALTGLHAIRVLQSRKKDSAPFSREAVSSSFFVARAILLHGLLLAFLAINGWWVAVAAWIIGVGAFFPLFASVRQILEHRDFDADPNADYTVIVHGAVTRIFRDDFFSATFGAAGFNRHLLHHWEPQISCTNLPELEAFLMESELAPVLERRRTSYWRAFTQLLHAPQSQLQ